MLWVALISICLVFLVLVLLVWVMKLFIATALKLYRSALHDRESEVLTIMSIKRAYSPWNSKIHGLTPLPERK